MKRSVTMHLRDIAFRTVSQLRSIVARGVRLKVRKIDAHLSEMASAAEFVHVGVKAADGRLDGFAVPLVCLGGEVDGRKPHDVIPRRDLFAVANISGEIAALSDGRG